MATFDGRGFEGPNGAILYLQERTPKSARLTLGPGVVVSQKRSRALVVSLLAVDDFGPDSVLDASIRLAQEALDLWAVKGVMARALAAVEDEHIVWWRRSTGELASRVWTTTQMNPTIEGHLTVLDQDGNDRPPTPEPVLAWHPSFRFFRLGQAATDLVEAFRNYYLALEAILSTIEPMALRPDGRPAEREATWLDRALPKAASLLDFSVYTAPGTNGDPIDAIRADIYTRARTRTFHAKTGAAVFLPHDDTTRTALRDSVARLRRLYIDLAQAVLGFRFIGGGLAPLGFQGMVSGLTIKQFYAASDAVEPAVAKKGLLPNQFVSFDAAHADEFDDEYHKAFVGTLSAREWPYGVIRQVGALTDDRVAIYEDLEGELDITGLEYIECVMAIASRDPRALGTRYLS